MTLTHRQIRDGIERSIRRLEERGNSLKRTLTNLGGELQHISGEISHLRERLDKLDRVEQELSPPSYDRDTENAEVLEGANVTPEKWTDSEARYEAQEAVNRADSHRPDISDEDYHIPDLNDLDPPEDEDTSMGETPQG